MRVLLKRTFNILVNELKEEISFQELTRHQISPALLRRRSSSISLARTIPNFPSQMASLTAHSDVHRYIKTEEQTTPWGHPVLDEKVTQNLR